VYHHAQLVQGVFFFFLITKRFCQFLSSKPAYQSKIAGAEGGGEEFSPSDFGSSLRISVSQGVYSSHSTMGAPDLV
jgi:hypothetical protein